MPRPKPSADQRQGMEQGQARDLERRRRPDQPDQPDQAVIRTQCGRTITVSRFAPEQLPASSGRVILDVPCESYDDREMWASLTPREARALAGLLLAQATSVERTEAERSSV